MIVVDLTAGADVVDVVERVRADPQTAPIPIVVLTTEAMPIERKQRLLGQIDRAAQKSELDRAQLLALVESVTGARDRTGAAWPVS